MIIYLFSFYATKTLTKHLVRLTINTLFICDVHSYIKYFLLNLFFDLNRKILRLKSERFNKNFAN